MRDTIQKLIKEELPDARIEIGDVTGSGNHFSLLVASDTFAGMPLLKQHQQVMDILKDVLKSEVHAVQIKTLTLEKYQDRS